MSKPVANGSSVPAWPTFTFLPSIDLIIDRTLATQSNDVQSISLSINKIPFISENFTLKSIHLTITYETGGDGLIIGGGTGGGDVAPLIAGTELVGKDIVGSGTGT